MTVERHLGPDTKETAVTNLETPPMQDLDHKQLKALAKASRPWWKKKRSWALGVLALIIVGGVASSGSSKNTDKKQNGGVSTISNNNDHPPQADVAIEKCGVDSIGIAQATLRITNHSSGRSDYMISVNFLDAAGTKIAEGTAFSNNIDPGQQAVETAGGTAEATPATCKVTSVDRFASH